MKTLETVEIYKPNIDQLLDVGLLTCPRCGQELAIAVKVESLEEIDNTWPDDPDSWRAHWIRVGAKKTVNFYCPHCQWEATREFLYWWYTPEELRKIREEGNDDNEAG